MSRIAYVNGQYVPHNMAGVSIDDRGYLFSDGVYEVCEVYHGQLVDETRHLDRLNRSLTELRINWPVDRNSLQFILREVVWRNHVKDGMVYLQVTRGVARRDHVFPSPDVPPALVVTARSIDRAAANAAAANGICVITVPENRWPRVDIKAIALLPNVLARQQAKEAGAKEAWFVDKDGFVTEGAATNAWIITNKNVWVTRPAADPILRGVTRMGVMDYLTQNGFVLEERPFTPEEAYSAQEAFLTAATTLIMPVVRIDDHIIGKGKPGEQTLKLRSHFHQTVEIR